MYRINVENTFSGAHRLRRYRGSCERLHGHNWKVVVTVEGQELPADGMLLDFRILKKKVTDVLKKFDHRYLNELKIFKKQEPTAEHIAHMLFQMINKSITKKNVCLYSVRVYESENTWADFIADPEPLA